MVNDNGEIEFTDDVKEDLLSLLLFMAVSPDEYGRLNETSGNRDMLRRNAPEGFMEEFIVNTIGHFHGYTKSPFDDALALIFGNKTTVGEVCAFARSLEDEIVEDVPGFCCMDAPYQNGNHWGEKVRKSKPIDIS